MMPSRNPGQFSTIVVRISCPPASSPSTRSGVRLARAVYSAAVKPAGPDPMMTTFRSATLRSALNCVRFEMPLDQLGDVVLRTQPDDRLRELAFLEDQQRRDPAHRIATWDVRVLVDVQLRDRCAAVIRSEEHTSELQSQFH